MSEQNNSGIALTNRGTRHPPADQGPARQSEPDDADDFRWTPVLPPVPRSKQASVLLSAFLTISLTIGYNQCYGVFQEYYLSPSQDVLSPAPASLPNPPTAEIAFVGTLGAGLTWAGSILVNPLLSRIEYLASTHGGRDASSAAPPRGTLQSAWLWLLLHLKAKHITISGVVLMSAGFLLASFAKTVPQLLLTQGLLYGTGSSMLYFPLLGPAPEYFTTHRATAIGVILSGGGVGGVALSPALRALLAKVGGPWTLRILAAISLVVGLPVAFSVPASRFPAIPLGNAAEMPESGQGPSPASSSSDPAAAAATAAMIRRRTRVPKSLLVTPAFVLAALGAFAQAAGAQLPVTFIPAYSVALGFSASTGATLLAVANGLNAVARVATGYAGDRLGRLNALVVTMLGAAAAVFGLWLSSVVTSAGGGSDGGGGTSASMQLWIAFVVLYSVAAGGYYALFPATIADVFGIRSYAAVNGFIYFVRGCGAMIGSPVGGALLGGRGAGHEGAGAGSYASAVYWDGALILGSAVCILGVRWADALRRGWMWRA